MRNDRLLELNDELIKIVGRKNVLSGQNSTQGYRKGIRVGEGKASFVVLPQDLVGFWNVLQICIKLDKVIIIQAANTGLTGGSTPDGDEYDRDVVIINTLALDKIILINNASQIIALPGATLSQLEKELLPFKREPHSLIGSSCIGASIVGGICNNSGGNLVNRGPAFTELSLYARVNSKRELELINHLDIELGQDPIEILENLQNSKFNLEKFYKTQRTASDFEYKERIRDLNSTSPARFNADKRRLFEASGCAGKIAVFAVRLDTFEKEEEEQVFLIGTNDPKDLTQIRKEMLSESKKLPDMAEYMHKSFFDGADKYGKDTFLIIKYLGQNFIPKLFIIKKRFDNIVSRFKFLPTDWFDKILHQHAQLIPDHLPKRIRQYRERFEHLLIIKSSGDCIKQTRIILHNNLNEIDFIECSELEGKDLLLHRYVAGIAPKRFAIMNSNTSGELLPLDVALPRNCDKWYQTLPEDIFINSSQVFQMGHFLCMVFHWDIVLNKGSDSSELKSSVFENLDKFGAKYPAEHNVGHLYMADHDLANFYKKIDPTNTFNSGIGKLSKNKNYAK